MFLSSFLIVFLPLIGSILLLFVGSNNKKLFTNLIAITAIGIPLVISSFLFINYLFDSTAVTSYILYTWLHSNKLIFSLGFLVDSLSIFMAFIVTSVSFLIHVYSIGYMKEDDGYNRFFIYTNFFTFSMLLIVFANNFLQLFIGWELVGLSSYLLIGFWVQKESAILANLKAFIVNRIGDVGLILGVCLVFVYCNSLDYFTFFESLDSLNNKSISFLGYDILVLPLIALLLFIGAAAKSAQIPLQFWLPDSMEGPTPISALIHAATMVTAGIFMIARLSPLYDQSIYVSDIILVIGCITALSMGLVALTQNDIKRIIAYSTISQLGYMAVALGATYYSLAIFHLMTHAFFKALLFLCAGSIILKCHHEQDIRKMGGLKKTMPITYMTFLLGALSLIGLPIFSGFFSKDLIVDVLMFEELPIAYYTLVLGIFITTLYISKIFFIVFNGEDKIQNINKNEAEHSKVILAPMGILAVFSTIIGLVLFEPVIKENFFSTSLTDTNRMTNFFKSYVLSSHEFIIHSFTSLNFFSLISGLVFSYLFFSKYPKLIDKFKNKFNKLYMILVGEYGFTYLSNTYFPKKIRRISEVLWKSSDEKIIDGYFVNGLANFINNFSLKIRNIQSGYLYHYAFTMIISLVLFLLFFYDF
ncbi:MAG: NADH-quinone oxidoreductase subunit L [Pseudomonadota bacterium]|nr:NADH-quinone oxidoreductase subunit L [Pseudomonadota bacterium]